MPSDLVMKIALHLLPISDCTARRVTQGKIAPKCPSELCKEEICFYLGALKEVLSCLSLLQSGESWNKVMHAKANGGVNMDLATRHCKDLKHFVMWSSFVASAGNEGTSSFTV